MLEFLFIVLMLVIFGRLAFFALRLAWGITKVVLTLVFLPLILIGGLVSGLISIAFPVLIVIGILSLIFVR